MFFPCIIIMEYGLEGIDMDERQKKFTENTDDSTWCSLYRAAGVAALLAALVFRRNLAAEISLISPVQIPEHAADWFNLLHANPFLGLAYLNVFDLVEYFLVGVLFLALYVLLSQTNRSWSLMALWMSVLAVGLNFASNQAFSMLALSLQYVNSSASQAASLAMSGESLLAVGSHGTAAYAGLMFISLAGLVFSILMLQSHYFGRFTGIIGIIANAIMLSVFLILPLVPQWIVFPYVLSAPLRVTWYILIGIKLLKTSKHH